MKPSEYNRVELRIKFGMPWFTNRKENTALYHSLNRTHVTFGTLYSRLQEDIILKLSRFYADASTEFIYRAGIVASTKIEVQCYCFVCMTDAN